MKEDVYQKITNQIVAALEAGVRPWMQPWNAEHAAGRIVRPLRANGIPYRGINTVMLWVEAVENGYAAPIWMTFKQAAELGAHVRKGERGSLVVYASTLHRTETDETSGAEIERDIPYMKGYTVFNVEQIEGLREQYTRPANVVLDPVQRIAHAEAFFTATGAEISHGGNRAYYAEGPDRIQMPLFETFKRASIRRWRTSAFTGRSTRAVLIAIWGASAGETKAMPPRSWWRNWARPFSAPISVSRRTFATIMPPISPTG